MWLFGILCVFFILGSARLADSARHSILPPLGSGDKDIAVIIIPEEGVRNIAYASLAEEIQITSSLPIWISLMDTDDVTLSSDTFPQLWADILELLAREGFNIDEDDIFLAGHGSRGSFAAEFALKERGVSGVILFGSLLPSGMKSSTFPLPVMTITGELDGLTRITSVAKFYREMAADVESDPQLLERNPLILLQGCNHALFSDGELSERMSILDIKSEVNDADARMLIANYTVRFLGSVTDQLRFKSSAKTMFQSAFKTAGSVLQPIVNIIALTANVALESKWIGIVQRWLSGLGPEDMTKLLVESYILEDASSIPPSMLDQNNKTLIITFSEIYQQINTRQEIAARMIGPERIHQWLNISSIVNKYNCNDLNYASFMTAYYMASEIARERYDSHHKGAIFHDDKLMQSDVAWEQSKLLVEVVDHELHVTAPNYQTPVSDVLGEWTGIFFCKLLPLDKALEWIYVDSLQNMLNSDNVFQGR